MINHALLVSLMLALLLVTGQLNGLAQSAPSPEEPEGAQQAASSMTGERQSAAKTAFCSALAGQYKSAATNGVSALTDPKVLLTAATNFQRYAGAGQ